MAMNARQFPDRWRGDLRKERSGPTEGRWEYQVLRKMERKSIFIKEMAFESSESHKWEKKAWVIWHSQDSLKIGEWPA